MMEFDVREIARQIRLGLSPAEVDPIEAYFNSFSTQIARLKRVDASAHTKNDQMLDQNLREDLALDSPVGRDELLALAPRSRDGEILVPRVID